MSQNRYQFLEIIKEDEEKRITRVWDKKTSKVLVCKVFLNSRNKKVYKQIFEYPHRGIPKIVEIKEEKGRLIIYEENSQGQVLSQMRGKQFNLDYVQSIIMDLCSIVDHLHNLKPPVIHRDIKPENVIISQEGIQLIDFDIARNYMVNQSKDTTVLGSIGFAAPEQFGFGQSDERTDIYAMGVLLNWMLTGKMLHEKLCQEPFRTVVVKATAVNPNLRYRKIKEVRRALEKRETEARGVELSFSMRKSKKGKESWALPGYRRKKKKIRIMATVIYIAIFSTMLSILTRVGSDETLYREDIMIGNIMVMWFLAILFYWDYRGWRSRFVSFEKPQTVVGSALSLIGLLFIALLIAVVLTR